MTCGPVEPGPALSPEGRARRAFMLPALQQEVQRSAVRRRVRRRAVQAVGALSVLAVALAAVIVLRPPRALERIAVLSSQSAPTSTIEIVATDPAVLARYTAATPPIDLSLYMVDDDDLLSLMERAGQPSGLARSGGRTWLVALSPPAQGPRS